MLKIKVIPHPDHIDVIKFSCEDDIPDSLQLYLGEQIQERFIKHNGIKMDELDIVQRFIDQIIAFLISIDFLWYNGFKKKWEWGPQREFEKNLHQAFGTWS